MGSNIGEKWQAQLQSMLELEDRKLQKVCSKIEEVELDKLVLLIMWKIIFRGSL